MYTKNWNVMLLYIIHANAGTIFNGNCELFFGETVDLQTHKQKCEKWSMTEHCIWGFKGIFISE